MADELNVVREQRDGAVVVHVDGDVDLASTHVLEQALAEAVHAGEHVVVDLAACPFLDSSALRTLVEAHRSAADAGGSLVVARADDNVRRVLEVASLDRLLGTFETVDEAIG